MFYVDDTFYYAGDGEVTIDFTTEALILSGKTFNIITPSVQFSTTALALTGQQFTATDNVITFSVTALANSLNNFSILEKTARAFSFFGI